MAIPSKAYLQIARDAHSGAIEGQVKSPPKYWISVTSGMSGFFAVMLWDGMGYPEPWDTGFGRYRTSAEAEQEGRDWAEAEGLEFKT